MYAYQSILVLQTVKKNWHMPFSSTPIFLSYIHKDEGNEKSDIRYFNENMEEC
jgi:hypothetical protein